jgi:hypothetical protein
MEFGISHDWADKSPEAKARWFQSMTVEQRIDMFNEFTDFMFELNPRIADAKPHAQPIPGRIQVLKRP